MAIRFENSGDGGFLLDAKGYGCPHVQIYTDKALKQMRVGDVLTVIFDNPASGESISFMCETAGDDLIERNTQGGTFVWKIRKG